LAETGFFAVVLGRELERPARKNLRSFHGCSLVAHVVATGFAVPSILRAVVFNDDTKVVDEDPTEDAILDEEPMRCRRTISQSMKLD